jgi:hypothetical protein
MIVNNKEQQMEIEERDWKYLMPAYLRQYLFINKGVAPVRAIFPMFKEIKLGDVVIPVEFVPDSSDIAVAIKEDGKDVHEVTPEEETKIDSADNARPSREPKLPDRVVPPGTPLHEHARDSMDLAKAKSDLAPEKDIDESKEKPVADDEIEKIEE